MCTWASFPCLCIHEPCSHPSLACGYIHLALQRLHDPCSMLHNPSSMLYGPSSMLHNMLHNPTSMLLHNPSSMLHNPSSLLYGTIKRSMQEFEQLVDHTRWNDSKAHHCTLNTLPILIENTITEAEDVSIKPPSYFSPN